MKKAFLISLVSLVMSAAFADTQQIILMPGDSAFYNGTAGSNGNMQANCVIKPLGFATAFINYSTKAIDTSGGSYNIVFDPSGGNFQIYQTSQLVQGFVTYQAGVPDPVYVTMSFTNQTNSLSKVQVTCYNNLNGFQFIPGHSAKSHK